MKRLSTKNDRENENLQDRQLASSKFLPEQVRESTKLETSS